MNKNKMINLMINLNSTRTMCSSSPTGVKPSRNKLYLMKPIKSYVDCDLKKKTSLPLAKYMKTKALFTVE